MDNNKLLDKIRNALGNKDRKNLFSNISSLIVLQVINLALPLITMPYLVIVLGADRYGLVMFAQAFVLYFTMVTDFGFNLSATREVAANKNNWSKISEVYSSVMIIKSVLFVLSIIVGYIIIISFDRFSEEKVLFFISFGIVFGQSLFPVWFFQGIEKMKNITILNVISKVTFTIGIFVFIRNPSDYHFVPILNSVGFIIAGVGAIAVVFTKYDVRFYIPSTVILLGYLKDSSHFFLSRVSVSIFTLSNTFILGIATTNTNVAFYSIAEKIYTAMQSVYYPITEGLYPYVVHKKDVPLFKKILKYVMAFNLVSTIVLVFVAPFVIRLLFGEGMEDSVVVFRFLLVALFVSVPSMLLGYPFTGALGKATIANYSVVAGAIVHISLILGLFYFESISIESVAIVVIVTESLILFIRLIGSIKFKLWSIKPIQIES